VGSAILNMWLVQTPYLQVIDTAHVPCQLTIKMACVDYFCHSVGIQPRYRHWVWYVGWTKQFLQEKHFRIERGM